MRLCFFVLQNRILSLETQYSRSDTLFFSADVGTGTIRVGIKSLLMLLTHQRMYFWYKFSVLEIARSTGSVLSIVNPLWDWKCYDDYEWILILGYNATACPWS